MNGVRALVVGALAACANAEPRELATGVDACEVCRMTITDTRYGGAVMMRTGRQRSFDSIECLADFLRSADSTTIARVLVSDFERQQLIDVREAVFLRGGKLRSPMGRELAAFAATRDSASLQQTFGGNVLSWHDVRALRIPHAPDTPTR